MHDGGDFLAEGGVIFVRVLDTFYKKSSRIFYKTLERTKQSWGKCFVFGFRLGNLNLNVSSLS